MQEKFEDDGLNQAYAEYAEMPSLSIPPDDPNELIYLGDSPSDTALTGLHNRVGKLIFNRDDHDGEAAFQRAVKADKAYGALWDITQKLRYFRKCKYGLVNFDQMDTELMDIIRESGIDLDNEYF